MKTNQDKNPSYFLTYKNSGLKGVLELFKNASQGNRLLELIAEFDRKHFVLFKFLSHLAALEAEVGQYGKDIQMLKLLKKLGIKLEIFNSYQNCQIGSKKGLLVYGINHDAFFEGFFLLTILKQKNVKLIAYRFYHFLGRNMRRFSYPVSARKTGQGGRKSLGKFLSPGLRFNNWEQISEDQRKINNYQSLKKAAKTLEQGGVVVIFPGGGGNELKKWRGGLSRIMMNISRNKRKEITLVPVYFSGLGRNRILLRIFRAYKNIRLKPLRVGVYFGRERNLAEIFSLYGERIRGRGLFIHPPRFFSHLDAPGFPSG